MEIQPAGWLDGKDTPGNLGGVADVSPPGDMISSIVMHWGDMGTEYNFGELLPGSIRGMVQSSPDGDCEDGIGETPIAGVQIDLLDSEGGVIATTFTDENGEYAFTNLRPGQYGVSEHQPEGYFQMDAHIGDGDGVVVNTDLMTGIDIGSDQHLVDYDFCETPPSSIAGQVQAHTGGECDFDNPQLVISGVTIELWDGQGNLFATTTTDSNGRYRFDGLMAGEYIVHEIQPEGYISDDDRVGTAGGQLDDTDTISHIELPAGVDAIHYDFCEMVPPPIAPPPPPPGPPLLPPPPPPAPPLVFGPQLAYVPPPLLPVGGPWIPQPGLYAGSVGGSSYTWHLSVVDAGAPRSVRYVDSVYQLTASQIDVTSSQKVSLDSARWTLATVSGDHVTILRSTIFGRADAIPVVGDWNGDGTMDIGVFVDGEWYLDLNGDGRWDQGDLWAKLGSRDDMPVVGDWDGDGKADIGIFGPAWPRDPWAIAHEPGIPDANNWPTWIPGKMKNMPPAADEATSGGRVMKKTGQAKSRTDLIDHVFYYGNQGDTAAGRRLERRRHSHDRRVPRRPLDARYRRRRPADR